MSTPAVIVRPFDDSRWDEVLGFADTVVPYDREGNRIWLANRRRFAASGRIRRHYAACGPDGKMIAYGAIEQQPDPKAYRMFIVPSAPDLWDTAGDALYAQLRQDLKALRALRVWLREYARDLDLIRFAHAHGFVEVEASEHPGPNGPVRVVRLELPINQ